MEEDETIRSDIKIESIGGHREIQFWKDRLLKEKYEKSHNTGEWKDTPEDAVISFIIDYKDSSTLEDVGEQLWNGAVLLSEFILHFRSFFQDRIVFEIGCGIGLSSMIASTICKHIYASDYKECIIERVQHVINQNGRNVEPESITCTLLDLTAEEAIPSIQRKALHLTDEENIDYFIGADLLYDEFLTENLFHFLQYCLPYYQCYCLLVGEHRYNVFWDGVRDYEYEQLDLYVCLQESCWEEYQKRENKRTNAKNCCHCGKRLVGCIVKDAIPQLCVNVSRPEGMYILLLSSIYL